MKETIAREKKTSNTIRSMRRHSTQHIILWKHHVKSEFFFALTSFRLLTLEIFAMAENLLDFVIR